jgi:hypothetical protein
MHDVEICSAEPILVKSDGPILEIRGSEISRSSDNLGKMTTPKPDD